MDCRLTVKDKAPAILRRAPSRRSRACQGTKRKGRRSVRMRTSASRYNARHINSRSIFREPTEEPLFRLHPKGCHFLARSVLVARSSCAFIVGLSGDSAHDGSNESCCRSPGYISSYRGPAPCRHRQ